MLCRLQPLSGPQCVADFFFRCLFLFPDHSSVSFKDSELSGLHSTNTGNRTHRKRCVCVSVAAWVIMHPFYVYPLCRQQTGAEHLPPKELSIFPFINVSHLPSCFFFADVPVRSVSTAQCQISMRASIPYLSFI